MERITSNTRAGAHELGVCSIDSKDNTRAQNDIDTLIARQATAHGPTFSPTSTRIHHLTRDRLPNSANKYVKQETVPRRPRPSSGASRPPGSPRMDPVELSKRVVSLGDMAAFERIGIAALGISMGPLRRALVRAAVVAIDDVHERLVLQAVIHRERL